MAGRRVPASTPTCLQGCLLFLSFCFHIESGTGPLVERSGKEGERERRGHRYLRSGSSSDRFWFWLTLLFSSVFLFLSQVLRRLEFSTQLQGAASCCAIGGQTYFQPECWALTRKISNSFQNSETTFSSPFKWFVFGLTTWLSLSTSFNLSFACTSGQVASLMLVYSLQVGI